MSPASAADRRRGLAIAIALVAGGSMLVVFLHGPSSPSREEAEPRPAIVADRYETVISLQSDGSLRVREEIAVEFGDRPARTFERVLRETHRDGLTDVVASVDGVVWPAGRGPGHVTVGGTDRVRVRWQLPAVPNASSIFGLEYIVRGAVGIEGAHGRVRWPAVPADRSYPVREAEIRFLADPATIFYDGTGVAQAGWTVAREAAGFRATQSALGPRDGGTFLAEFATDAGKLPRPQWQDDEERSAELLPAFVSGALFILVVAAGILWIVRLQHPGAAVSLRDSQPAEVPVAAAFAVALADRGRGTRVPIVGTVVDLGGRGVIAFAPGEGSTLHVTSQSTSAGATRLAHERVVAEAVAALTGRDVPRWRVRAAIAKSMRRYQRALRDDLVSAGLADPDRIAAARGLMIGGAVSVAMAGVAAAMVAVWLPRFGPWPFVIPASLGVGGLALVIGGAAFSRLSEAGEREAAAWRLRLRWIRRLRQEEADTEPVEAATRWLGVAAADGRGSAWLRLFARRLVGMDDAIAWWAPASGESAADGAVRFLQEVERSMRPKAH